MPTATNTVARSWPGFCNWTKSGADAAPRPRTSATAIAKPATPVPRAAKLTKLCGAMLDSPFSRLFFPLLLPRPSPLQPSLRYLYVILWSLFVREPLPCPRMSPHSINAPSSLAPLVRLLRQLRPRHAIRAHLLRTCANARLLCSVRGDRHAFAHIPLAPGIPPHSLAHLSTNA